jgi:transposase
VPLVAGPRFVGHDRHAVNMRTAYRCRAYPHQAQQAVLNRTFGCVRVVWNRTLAARRERYTADRKGTSYAETDRALTAMKKDRGLAFLCDVSSVPLQQALRHQHQAFCAFFAKRTRYPRYTSRSSRRQAVTACGADVRHSGTSRMQSAAKQEPRLVRAGIPVLQDGE